MTAVEIISEIHALLEGSGGIVAGKLYSAKDIAERWGCSTDTVYAIPETELPRVRYSGLMYLDDRKADARSRTVPLVHDLAVELYNLAADLEPTDRVFGIQYHQVDYLWREARAKIGREDARFKDLRHTFAVLAHSVGITLNDIKTGMGHGKLSTTTRYTDHDAAFSMENAEKMARLLRAG